jgi:orotate phosphoribosyltransferase
VLAVLTAQALSEGGIEIPAIWADKVQEGVFRFTRTGFAERLRHQRVLVVEDFITTGGPVTKVCHEVESLGGDIIGVSAICNRGGVTAEQLSVPQLCVLAEMNAASFLPENCPLCAEQVMIVVDVGHGTDFRRQHPYYPGGYSRQEDWAHPGLTDKLRVTGGELAS